MEERSGEVTFKGSGVTLLGRRLKVGDKAPDFKLKANDLSDISLKDTAGKTRIFSVVPSLDTSVCDLQGRRFNDEAAKVGDGIKIYVVSADLPFAQKRWCGAANATNVQTLSDYYDMNFGNAWGTHIKELRLDSRAVFVVDQDGVVRYAEYVPEVTQHPEYEKAIEAAKTL